MEITQFSPKRVNMPKLHQRFWDNHRVTYFLVTNREDGGIYLQASIGYNAQGTAYARVSVWLTTESGSPEWVQGFGRASGYGYCKRSAALYEAFRSIGIHIDGLSGTGRMEDACQLVAEQGRGRVNLRVVTI